MSTLINAYSATPIRRPREAQPLGADCDVEKTYADAIKTVRKLVELNGVNVEEAINIAAVNAGLGLNQIVRFKREVLQKYRPHLMAAE